MFLKANYQSHTIHDALHFCSLCMIWWVLNLKTFPNRISRHFSNPAKYIYTFLNNTWKFRPSNTNPAVAKKNFRYPICTSKMPKQTLYFSYFWTHILLMIHSNFPIYLSFIYVCSWSLLWCWNAKKRKKKEIKIQQYGSTEQTVHIL